MSQSFGSLPAQAEPRIPIPFDNPSQVGSACPFDLLGGITFTATLGFPAWATGIYPHPEKSNVPHIGRQSIVVRRRNRELGWRETHRDTLLAYQNHWVVLEGEEIVSHGIDPLQVVFEAKAKGIKVPYVFYVEALSEDTVRIGL